MASRFKRPVPVTVNDVLDGHVGWTWSAWTVSIFTAIWARCRSEGR